MQGNNARALDQFYTHPYVSEIFFKKLISLLPNALENRFIEPSAGNGAFSDLLLSSGLDFEALDLDPRKPYIKQQDFFDYSPVDSDKKIVVVGNPPFGKNASLALRFFNKSSEFCDVIAFILPATFKKQSIQKKMALNFHLVHEEDTPYNSFIFEGNSYNVPCVFQIWEKRDGERVYSSPPSTSDFAFVKTALNADLAFQRVGAYAGKTTLAPECADKNPNSHFFLKFRTRKALKEFLKCDFTTFKLCTAGCPSISKSEILHIWNNKRS